MAKYFGTDGFRGRANETLDAVHAFRIGRFLGRFYARGDRRARIVVGKDTRLSSYMFEYALAAGATASGADVYLLHVTTTPSVSFVTRAEGFDCGVMISASHNLYADNGIKLLGAGGEKIEEETIRALEAYLDGADAPFATGERIGRTIDHVAGRNRYLSYLLSVPHTSFRGVRVGLDCANGSAWAVAKAVFDALGAQVFAIGAEPDGRNINEGCGSTCLSPLRSLVVEKGLDAGFAFDGDADRCICIDEKGGVLDGDAILFAAARDLYERGELDGGGVVATVMSNRGLIRSLARYHIDCVTAAVGDKCVYDELLRRGYALGGEPSGHVIFRKYATTGDGILTALRMTEIMLGRKCALSCLASGLIRDEQLVRSVAVRDRRIVHRGGVRAAIARAEAALPEGGRLLVRPSGTELLIRILAEGESREMCARAVSLVERALREEEDGACAGS